MSCYYSLSLILSGPAQICLFLSLFILRSLHHNLLCSLSFRYLSPTTSLHGLPRLSGHYAGVSETLYVPTFLLFPCLPLYGSLPVSISLSSSLPVPTLGTKWCLHRACLASSRSRPGHSTVPLRAFQLQTKSPTPTFPCPSHRVMQEQLPELALLSSPGGESPPPGQLGPAPTAPFRAAEIPAQTPPFLLRSELRPSRKVDPARQTKVWERSSVRADRESEGGGGRELRDGRASRRVDR